MTDHLVGPRIVKFLDSIDAADEVTRVRCSMAVSLAMKLDEAIADSSVGSAMAAPAISKELRATLEEILATNDNKDAFIADIFQR